MPNAANQAALLSLSDKEGLKELAGELARHGLHLIATAGTAAAIRAAGIGCTEISALTGSESLLGGRLKTLHAKIFAGILARRSSAQDMQELSTLQAPPLAVVAVNLYPFEQTAAGDAPEAAVEQIDVGGVALIRAAAKNYRDVCVLTKPAQYRDFCSRLAAGGPSLAERRALAADAFVLCARYDAAIAQYLLARCNERPSHHPADCALPEVLQPVLRAVLRPSYGENPPSRAAFYACPGKTALPQQLAGKPLSYNNILDVDACLRLLSPLAPPAGFPATALRRRAVTAAIVKHTIPCGVAARETCAHALQAALGADPVSAYGGIVACDAVLDDAAAQLLQARFIEVVVAPGFEPAALRRLQAKKNLRLLTFDRGLPRALLGALKARSALRGMLVEQPDAAPHDAAWQALQDLDSEAQWRDLLFALGVVRHVKSNAAVVAKDEVTLGICGGQTSRVSAVELACARAGTMAKGAVLASDGFFPFADGVLAAAAAGVAAVVAPKGSIRDAEVIAGARSAGVHLVFCNRRYFSH